MVRDDRFLFIFFFFVLLPLNPDETCKSRGCILVRRTRSRLTLNTRTVVAERAKIKKKNQPSGNSTSAGARRVMRTAVGAWCLVDGPPPPPPPGGHTILSASTSLSHRRRRTSRYRRTYNIANMINTRPRPGCR